MTINLELAIQKMQEFKNNRIYYSNVEPKDGSQGHADCSGALVAAGANRTSNGTPYTDTLHQWLLDNGFYCVHDVGPGYGFSDAQRGDVFIWGEKWHSAGNAGHAGIFMDNTTIIHYTSPGVSNYQRMWEDDGRPYSYLYRLKPQSTAVDRSVITIYTTPG